MTVAEIFASELMRHIVFRAVLVGVLVSLSSSLLGVSLVTRHYSMIGDGLSHVGYFALALGAAAGVGTGARTAIALPVVICAAILILRLERSGRISGDSACAIVATGSVAIGTIIFGISGTNTSDICSSLFGSSSVVTVTARDAVCAVVLAAVVCGAVFVGRRLVFAVTFDEQFAAAAGCRVGTLRTALAILTAVTIVVGMKMMGAIMISALIVFPAMTAMQLARSFRSVLITSAAVSVISFIIGFILACRYSLQTGAAVVTCELTVFVISVAVSRIRCRIGRQRAAS